ncbi:hypothetical protein ADUPG1_003425, partial [Aduncisulcus paluster]
SVNVTGTISGYLVQITHSSGTVNITSITSYSSLSVSSTSGSLSSSTSGSWYADGDITISATGSGATIELKTVGGEYCDSVTINGNNINVSTLIEAANDIIINGSSSAPVSLGTMISHFGKIIVTGYDVTQSDTFTATYSGGSISVT